VLYVQALTLRGMDPRTNSFTILIGDGLFSRIAFHKGDHIADYNGDLISLEEADIRVARGHGGCMIYINESSRMDCYANCMNYRCKASKANRNTKAFNTFTGRGAITNSRMIWSTSSAGVVRVRLEATRLIQMHTEIITYYGQGFKYPSIQEEEAKEEEQD